MTIGSSECTDALNQYVTKDSLEEVAIQILLITSGENFELLNIDAMVGCQSINCVHNNRIREEIGIQEELHKLFFIRANYSYSIESIFEREIYIMDEKKKVGTKTKVLIGCMQSSGV
jgi:hypothetical protein